MDFPWLSAVALSRGSTSTSPPRRMAASRTVRAIGPAVSCVCEMGITPDRLTRPTVGLMPTMPLIEEGLMIEPLVSVPMAAAHRLVATATAEPELEPEVLRFNTYGFLVSPPRPLQPLVE